MEKKRKFCLLVHYRNPYIVSAGTEKYIQLQTDCFSKNDLDTVLIFPIRKKAGLSIFGWGLIINKEFKGAFDEEALKNRLTDYASPKECRGVFVHHLLWSQVESLGRILSFADQIVFYIHDYYTCCVQQNLLRNATEYCGDGTISDDKCGGCQYYHDSVVEKEKIRAFLDSFKEVKIIAPSTVAKDVWLEGFPEYESSVEVLDHLLVSTEPGDTRPELEDEIINIAFVGNGMVSKGWNQWQEAVSDMSPDVKKLYHFYHLGTGTGDIKDVEHVSVDICKDGPDAMVKKLQELNIHIAVLFSIWPETYSYTFFEALEAKCFVITNKESGNIARQVQEYANGIIINKDGLKELLLENQKLKDFVNYYYKNKTVNMTKVYNEGYMDLLEGSYAYKADNRQSTFSEKVSAHFANALYRFRYRKVL